MNKQVVYTYIVLYSDDSFERHYTNNYDDIQAVADTMESSTVIDVYKDNDSLCYIQRFKDGSIHTLFTTI